MTTMANLWIRLKPCPVTLMLRPPLVGEGAAEWARPGREVPGQLQVGTLRGWGP